MLRNTSNGNELALPATNAFVREHTVGCWYTVAMLGPRTAGVVRRWLLRDAVTLTSSENGASQQHGSEVTSR